MAVASLVLGIVSLVSCVIGLGFPVGTICGVVGIILGYMGKKNAPENSGMATAGMVCSIIGTILSLISIVACTACVGGTAGLAGMLD